MNILKKNEIRIYANSLVNISDCNIKFSKTSGWHPYPLRDIISFILNVNITFYMCS